MSAENDPNTTRVGEILFFDLSPEGSSYKRYSYTIPALGYAGMLHAYQPDEKDTFHVYPDEGGLLYGRSAPNETLQAAAEEIISATPELHTVPVTRHYAISETAR